MMPANPLSPEFQLIYRYFYRALEDSADVICGIGDDAAIVSVPPGTELVISMDTLVEGIHFFPGTRASDIGYKSLAVNLSDLAAMGAEPCWISLSLTMPGSDENWLQQFMEGFCSLARQYSLSLIGGDLTRGPLSVTIQVHGKVPEGKAIYRNGARPGDRVFVSGTLGDAGAGLDILNKKIVLENGKTVQELLQRLNRPEPRIALGMALRGIASSAIDISDGLLSDLNHILRASHAGANIHVKDIPIPAALGNDSRAMEYAVAAGDDYELCFTVPPANDDKLSVLARQFPLTCIGEIIEGSDLKWLNADGSDYVPSRRAYSHFQE